MKILAISPHTDDAELGAGGSIARWVEEGHEVFCFALSTGNPETGAEYSEYQAAMDVLGAIVWGTFFNARYFHDNRQIILQYLVNIRRDIDLILVPSHANIHQDHEVVTAEAIRAFRECSILGYELPWGDVRPFTPQLYVKLTTEQVEKKLAALACYESQQIRHYLDEKVVMSQARLRGAHIKTEYAEAFEVIRWVM